MTILELPSRNLRLIDAQAMVDLNKPWLLVHSIRTTFLVCVLLISVAYQIHLGNFINLEIWLPCYAVLTLNFLFNSIYLFRFANIENHGIWNGVLFALDTIAVTLLIYFTGTAQSLFLFLYLLNLILGSLVFARDGAWSLTIWTSICFSALLIISPDVMGQNLYFSIVVNNLAFVAVTFLSGRLSLQLTAVGTQLRETRTDLVVLQNLNDLIVNNITTGILVVSRTGFVQYFNPTASRIIGKQNFLQMKLADVVPDLGWPWRELVEDESKSFERRNLQVPNEGGGERYLEVVAARFRDNEGKLKGWLFLFDDRTDQRLMEESFRQREKLAAVGQLAAGIAHEIRNPLASISGSIQLMLSNPSQHNEEDVKLMRIVDKEIDRLNLLISDFLIYVRPETKAGTPIDLNAILREVTESIKFNPKLRQDIEQKLSLNARSSILGNRDKLKQAILNFVINAYQAMDKTERPAFEVSTNDDGDKVVLTIKDNGCGIKKENIHRIFEPFHTTKPQGTGLGLAITHKILEAHEAQVHVESKEGIGTQFVIEFPAHRDVHTEDLITLHKKAKG